jgi:TnpA family transposase
VQNGLVEHETELDPRTVSIDTHGYTKVVMATAALLGRHWRRASPACAN